jgi:hypothetical protein
MPNAFYLSLSFGKRKRRSRRRITVLNIALFSILPSVFNSGLVVTASLLPASPSLDSLGRRVESSTCSFSHTLKVCIPTNEKKNQSKHCNRPHDPHKEGSTKYYATRDKSSFFLFRVSLMIQRYLSTRPLIRSLYSL